MEIWMTPFNILPMKVSENIPQVFLLDPIFSHKSRQTTVSRQERMRIYGLWQNQRGRRITVVIQ